MGHQAPSKTARNVAFNILALGAWPRVRDVLPPGIVDATARLLAACGVAGPRAIRFARSRLAVAIYLAFDWMMPGQFEAFAHRKAFIERQVRKGIEAGAGQILVFGAGYDTLGWRLAPEFPEVRFFELDHPSTATPKAGGIAAMGERPNLCLVAEDLQEHSLRSALNGVAAWDDKIPSVVLAEGLLMYLPPSAVEELFRQCAATTGPGSRIAFTYLGLRPNGSPDAGPWTWLLQRILRSSGEPWLWGVRPEELSSFLEANGWRLEPAQTIGSSRRGIEFHAVAVK